MTPHTFTLQAFSVVLGGVTESARNSTGGTYRGSRSEAEFIASFPNLEDRYVVNPPHLHAQGHRTNPSNSRQETRRGPETVGVSPGVVLAIMGLGLLG